LKGNSGDTILPDFEICARKMSRCHFFAIYNFSTLRLSKLLFQRA